MSDIMIDIPRGSSKLLLTAGKWCNDDILINALSGNPSISSDIINSNPNLFNFTLDPGTSTRLLTSNKYCDRDIIVTVKDIAPVTTLNIADGSVTITDTGYSQGESPEISWGSNTTHEIMITGTSNGEQNIVLEGGNPTIIFNNVNMTVNGTYVSGMLLYGGTDNGINRAVNAQLMLIGNNSILCEDSTPIQININATLTIIGNGTLNVETNRGNTPGIGCGDSNTYAYISETGDAARNNSYRNYGNLIIDGGTVSSTANGRGTNQYVASIGDSYYANFGNVTINGGKITLNNKDLNGCGISGQIITITNGLIEDNTVGSKSGINAQESFDMSGGTIFSDNKISGTTNINITGGNITNIYDGEVSGRILCYITFYDNSGSILPNTEIEVKEGSSNSWFAYTDSNGIITTYFLSNDGISVSQTIYAGLIGQELKEVTFNGNQGTVN